MATSRIKYKIDKCPHCMTTHMMTVESTLRQVAGARETRSRVQIFCICKYTGFAFFSVVEVLVPANAQFARSRAVSFANGD